MAILDEQDALDAKGIIPASYLGKYHNTTTRKPGLAEDKTVVSFMQILEYIEKRKKGVKNAQQKKRDRKLAKGKSRAASDASANEEDAELEELPDEEEDSFALIDNDFSEESLAQGDEGSDLQRQQDDGPRFTGDAASNQLHDDYLETNNHRKTKQRVDEDTQELIREVGGETQRLKPLGVYDSYENTWTESAAADEQDPSHRHDTVEQ